MRKAFTFFLLVSLIFCLCGCGKSPEVSSSSAKKDITAQLILSSVSSENLDHVIYLGDDTFDNSCKKLYYTDVSQLSDGGISYASGEGKADEISVLKFSDDTDGEAILQKRVFVRLNTFKSYKPDEVDKINNAQIFQKDGYWILVISDSAEQIRDFIEKL